VAAADLTVAVAAAEIAITTDMETAVAKATVGHNIVYNTNKKSRF
jgi:hypothetical protein